MKRQPPSEFLVHLDEEHQTASIIQYISPKKNINIPRFVEHDLMNFEITSIETESFSQNLDIQSLSFAEDSTLLIINRSAFKDSSIKKIQIPKNVKYLDGFANGAKYLKKIILSPQNHHFQFISGNYLVSKTNENCTLIYCNRNNKLAMIPSNIQKIGIAAFESSKVSSVIFLRTADGKSHINELCEDSFASCNHLTSIEIPESIQKIGDHAFSKCTNLLSAIFLNIESSKLTEIGDYAFYQCNNLNSIKIPPSVVRIGVASFGFCKDLQIFDFHSTKNNDYNIEEISNYAFWECSNLCCISIPYSVKTIGSRAFELCGNLKAVNFMINKKGVSSISAIHDCAFLACSSLKSLVIPESVSFIGSECFSNNARLTTVECFSENIKLGKLCFLNCPKLRILSFPNATQIVIEENELSNSEFVLYTKHPISK